MHDVLLKDITAETVRRNMRPKGNINIRLGKLNVPWVWARVPFIVGNQGSYTLGKSSAMSTLDTTTRRRILF